DRRPRGRTGPAHDVSEAPGAARLLAGHAHRLPPTGRLHPGRSDPAPAGPPPPPLRAPRSPAHHHGQDLYRQARRGPRPALGRGGGTPCAPARRRGGGTPCAVSEALI